MPVLKVLSCRYCPLYTFNNSNFPELDTLQCIGTPGCNKENKTIFDNKIIEGVPLSADTCGICLNDLNELGTYDSDSDKVNIVKLINIKCGHKFHKQCIIMWATTKNLTGEDGKPVIQCPTCRALSFGMRKIKRRISRKRSRKRKNHHSKLPKRRRSRKSRRRSRYPVNRDVRANR